MKASFVAAVACAAALALTTACGSEERAGNPAPAITKENSSYGQKEFIRDIEAAGWPSSDPELGTTEESYYYEALLQCREQKSGGNPGAMKYMEDLARFVKDSDPELASADVDAYMTAVKKTCGLK